MREATRAPSWFPAKEIFILLAALSLYNFIRVAIMVIGEPHILNYTEGISLLAADRVRHGLSLYPPLDMPPFVYLAYPPVYPYVTGGVVALFGVHLAPLRVFSVLCEVGAGALVYAILVQRGLDRLRAGCLAAILLGVYSLNKFHAIARLDHLVVVFELLAVYLALVAQARPTARNLAALALVALLAMLTKPTAALTLGALGLAMLWRAWRQRDGASRRVVVALAAGAGSYVVAVLLLQLASGGRFWQYTITDQALSGVYTQWGRFGPFAVLMARHQALLLVLLALPLFMRSGFFGVLALVQMAWLYVSSRKMGADANYQLVPLAFVVVAAGNALVAAEPRWPRLAERTARIPWRTVAVPLLLVVAVGHGILTIAGGSGDWEAKALLFYRDQLQPEPRAARQRMVDAVAQSPPGPVLVEEPYFAVVNGREYIMSDPFHILLMARQGEFNLAPVLARIKDVNLAIVGNRLGGSPEVRRAIAGLSLVEASPCLDFADTLTLFRRTR